MEFLLSPIVLFFIVVVVFGFKSFIVVPQQEVYVVERLGRFHKALTAGLNILIPFIDRVAYRHSLKEVPLDVPSQVCITRDNTQLTVDGIIYFQVTDPKLASIWFQQLHHGDYPACADNFAICHRPHGIG